MGTFFSQHFNEVFDEEITNGSGRRPTDGSPSSSKLNRTNETPRPRVLECDPRSPTDGITRTPIEVFSAPKGHQATFSHLRYENTPTIACDPTPKFSCIDPRSPALGLGFTRTPIRLLDVSDSAEEITHEDVEQASYTTIADESTEGDQLYACHTVEDIEEVFDVALVDESVEEDQGDSSHTAEDIEQVLQMALVAESTECYDASCTAEDIDQVSQVTYIAKSTEDDRHDASQTAEYVDQESHVALEAELTGNYLVEMASAKEERVHQEIFQGIDIVCKPSAGKNTSEVATPIRHTIKMDCLPTSRVDNLKKDVVNTCLYSLDTPKSIDNVKRFVIDKENSSGAKKQVFCTPEKRAEDGAQPKVRTPLGTVCGNNSPMQMLRDKQSNTVKKSLSSRPSQFTQFNRTTVDRP